MEYKPANNSYSNYEKHIHNETKKNISEMNFMKNIDIMGVFGVDNNWGHEYSNLIQKEFPDFVTIVKKGLLDNKLQLFNSLGSPNLYYCSVFERNISANCARYIYHALIIQTYIYKKYEDTSIDIVEIGGGYGGLAYWLNVLNKNINKYSICDLDVITHFQKKCLDYYEVKCDFITNPYSFLKSDKPLFCISNYGFSEFNNYFQEIYTEYITSKAESGFMIWNNWTGIFPFTNNTMIKEKERPEFPDIYNLFIYF